MERSGLSLRRLEGHEWRLLRELRLAAVADAPEAFLVHPERERPDVDDDWRTYLHAGTWLVAEDAGRVTGMLCLVVDPETRGRYVESMWVTPSHRHLGVGARLLDSAAALARSARQQRLFLWVLDGNDRARSFYLRQGFRPTGRRQPIGRGRVEEEFQAEVSRAAALSGVEAALTR